MFADSVLRTFLVDQIHDVVVSVVLLLSVHVSLVGVFTLQLALFDRQSWTPFEVGSLLPDDRDAASGLKVCVNFIAIVVYEGQNLLGLCEVTDIAFEIGTSRDESDTGSLLISS